MLAWADPKNRKLEGVCHTRLQYRYSRLDFPKIWCEIEGAVRNPTGTAAAVKLDTPICKPALPKASCQGHCHMAAGNRAASCCWQAQIPASGWSMSVDNKTQNRKLFTGNHKGRQKGPRHSLPALNLQGLSWNFSFDYVGFLFSFSRNIVLREERAVLVMESLHKGLSCVWYLPG